MNAAARCGAVTVAVMLITAGCTTLPTLDDVAATGVRVDSVTDGDTLTIRDTAGFPTVVRLLGIGAPELAHDGQPAECGAQAAKEALTQLVKGRRVNLLTDPGSDRTDRYGRLLAYVEELKAGDIAEQLIRHGLVVAWYPPSAARPSRADTYEQVQRVAEQSQVGSWTHCPDMGGK